MKVFISWSGDRSKKVAVLLDSWLQCVIQAVDPWLSTKDIDRGALWFTEINEALSNTTIGILCLTKENKNKPWILFEAGALAKGLTKNRVCPFLIDLVPTDLENPLAQFNHTLPNKESVFELVRTINSSLGPESLKQNILSSVFDTYWPQFEYSFKQIIDTTPETTVEEKRGTDDIMLEMLSTVRSFDRRLREIENDKNGRPPAGANFVSNSVKLKILEDALDIAKNGSSRERIVSELSEKYPLNQLHEAIAQLYPTSSLFKSTNNDGFNHEAKD